MSLARVSDIALKCYDGGQSWEAGFRKVPAIATTTPHWTDLSLAPGNPKPNYYVGAELTSTVLDGTYGMFHGGAVSPKTKHLHKLLIGSTSASAAGAYYLLDYLAFYPLVDMDSTDEQALVNSVALPRYTDGLGVQAMLVATNPYLGGAGFFITYTNERGESGRQSQYEVSNLATYIGTVIHSGGTATSGGPFIRLQRGDRGIQSVQSVTFMAPNGGLAALVLAKPLANFVINGNTAFAEHDFLMMKPTLPRILDGAYLNMIVNPLGSMAAVPLTGVITTIWN